MNPAVITAPIDEAREKRDQYAAFNGKRRKPDAEYVAAEQIYALLAQGKELIDVGRAIRDGGFDAEMRPRLAIARADRRQVCFLWRYNSDSAAFNANVSEQWGQQHRSLIERVNFNRRHGVVKYHDAARTRYYLPDIKAFALAPLIPPQHRPAGPLSQFHILWEVEQWAEQRIGAVPPVDPFLLKRVAGDVFEILAKWDLTDVERMVMEGRAAVRG